MNSLRTAVWCLVFLAICAAAGLAQEEIRKVSRNEAMAAAVTKVQPEYPTIAKQVKVQGAVELEAVVAEDGSVEKVNIVSGNAVLTRPAVDALKKWGFKPFTSGGKPVKVLAPVGFDSSIEPIQGEST